MPLYLRYIGIQLRGQMQRRLSFVLLLFGQALVPLFMLAGIVMLFDRFPSVAGWTRAEALLCYGIAHMAFAIATCFARGFDAFQGIVQNGEFDRILVRPRGTVLQVLGQRFDLSRSGRLIQGAIVLAWALGEVRVPWDFPRIVTLVAMIACGSLVFSGIYQLGAVLSFRTVQGIELVSILSDGGRELSQYPIAIYPASIRRFFTFAVPFACFNYVPLLWLLGKPGGSPFWGPIAPWAGMLFSVPCALAWRAGVRGYLSTGS